MKLQINKSLFLVFALLSAFTFISCESENQKIHYDVILDISLGREEYQINDKIWLTVRLVNNSGKDYYLKEFFRTTTIQLDITAPDNSKWINTYNGIAPRFMERDSINLSAGEIKEISYPINIIYHPSGNDYPIGKYRVTCKYQGLESNEVYFDLKN